MHAFPIDIVVIRYGPLDISNSSCILLNNLQALPFLAQNSIHDTYKLFWTYNRRVG